MKIIKPDSIDQNYYKTDGASIFLAGSIEMGTAEDWQQRVINEFEENNLVFFNPRRDDWDSSWVQDQNTPEFNYQVNWEMNRLDMCDIIFMYFDPNTQSPISLLELGAYGGTEKMIVCCPQGFWRKGNVDIFCTRNYIPLFNDFNAALGALQTRINTQKR